MGKQKVLELNTIALGPDGIIILITDVGGVIKQIYHFMDSGLD